MRSRLASLLRRCADRLDPTSGWLPTQVGGDGWEWHLDAGGWPEFLAYEIAPEEPAA